MYNTPSGNFVCEGNLAALGGSRYLCTTRHPLFYVTHSELRPYGVSSDDPMYKTPQSRLWYSSLYYLGSEATLGVYT
eukprot:956938-Prorocentrum_minimum.AAC.1